MAKKENILFVERCIREIQLRKNVEKNLHFIENAIKREFGIKIDIIVNENKTNQFFGMCVYPDMSQIDQICKEIMNTGGIKAIERMHRDWLLKYTQNVEIDSILLYDSNLNASAGEITAILLHELGHVVASNTMVERLKRVKECLLAKSDLKLRRLFRELPFTQDLMKIPVAQALSNQFNGQLNKETKADNLAIREGYSDELYSVLNKLVINGKGSLVNKTEGEIDKDIEITVNWLVVNVKELEYRKDRLKKELNLLTMVTPTHFIKDMINKMKVSFFKDDQKHVRFSLINEAFIMSSIKPKKEKAPFGVMDHSGRVKKLQMRDLDIYRAELDRVHTTDDKIFLLEKLYDLLDHAEYALYLLNYDENGKRNVPQSESSIKNFITNLNEIISQVNGKKIGQEKFGLYIKYPSDYEG